MSAPKLPQLKDIAPEHRNRATGVLTTLQSFFLEMPRGKSFCERETFKRAYDVFAASTCRGQRLTGEALIEAVEADPHVWLVLRSVIGMSPGEMAYLAVERAAVIGAQLFVNQTHAREMDLRARRGQRLLFSDMKPRGKKQALYDDLLRQLLPLIAGILQSSSPAVDDGVIHRLDKIDTAHGQASLSKALAEGVVPYSELLYERMLGRPFATHRDSVSYIIGKYIEGAIHDFCRMHNIDGRPTASRERVPGFPQAPDFLIPSVNPHVIIEAKLTEDDGTARDKAARLQTLRQYVDQRPGAPVEIVAIVDGRGFSHRGSDLQRMLEACNGHVYTLEELPLLIAPSGPLARFLNTASADA